MIIDFVKSMKLSVKIMVISLSAILMASLCIVTITITSIQMNGEKELEIFRSEEMKKIRQSLKSSIDIAYETIKSNYHDSTNKEYLEHHYGHRLKNIIDVAESLINEKMKLIRSGSLTRSEAQLQVIREIKKMRYDDGTGYVWINDTGRSIPRMIMHPTIPSLDGKILDNPEFNCAEGTKKNLFVAFVDVCLKDNEGFVECLWPKPTKDGLTEEMPKESYVRLFEPWNWIIGSGVYVDDIDKMVYEKKKSISEHINSLIIMIIITSIIVSIILALALVFLLRSFLNPISQMAAKFKEISVGQGDLTKRITIKSKDEIGGLGTSFNSFVSSLHSIVINIKQSVFGTQDNIKQLAINTVQTSASAEQITGNSNEAIRKTAKLSEIVDKTAASVEQINANTSNINMLVENQSSAVIESSASVEEMTASLNNISKVANAKREAIDTMINKIKNSSILIEESLKSVKEVSEKGKSMLNVIDVIQVIAGQINLLGVNASIEAAHVGEFGKGFSVVAEEIRKLSLLANEKTKIITDIIKANQDAIDQAVDKAVTAAAMI